MDGPNHEQNEQQPAERPFELNDAHEVGGPNSAPDEPWDAPPQSPGQPPASSQSQPSHDAPLMPSTPPSDGSAHWPAPPAAWGRPPSPPVPPPPVPRARLLLLWAVVLIIVGFIMTWPYLLTQRAIEAMPDGPNVNAGMTRFQGRYIVAMDLIGQQQSGMSSSQILHEAEALADDSPTYTDYTKWVVVIAEVAGPEEAIWRLEALRSWEYEDDEIASLPLEELELVYTDGSAALDESQRAAVLNDLDWFGKLALSWDQADTDPLRKEVTWDATRTALVLVAVAVMGIGGVLVGLILLIVALVAAVNGSLRFKYDAARPPRPSRLIYLEAVILFLLAMVAFDALLVVTQGVVPQWIAMQAVWLTLFIPLWVRLRGEPMARLRGAIGWHRGRGVFREIGSGLVGYLAAIPLMGLGFGVTLLLMLLVTQLSADEWAEATGHNDTWQGSEQVAPDGTPGGDPQSAFETDDPLAEDSQEQPAGADESAEQSAAIDNDLGPVHPLPFELADAGGLEFIFLMLLASLWAPIVEETVFRGMLQHHLRGYRGVVVSALIVGFIFAAIHPQGLMGIPVLMSVSLSLSIVREWRGSIIAPMTMHAVHNTLLLTMAVLAFG